MNVSTAQLIAAGVGPAQARTFVDPLNAAMDRFDIVTAPRIAAFLGQCMVESGYLVHTEEGLFYRDASRLALIFPSTFRTAADAAPYVKNPQKLASHIYAGRNGNGDEASGDGWAFRGRGLLQVTGRANYTDAAEALARPYVDQPELVAQLADACLTAAWYWHVHKLNALAEASALDEITRAINGKAMLEAGLRRQLTREALLALT
jgi:putative chitinase